MTQLIKTMTIRNHKVEFYKGNGTKKYKAIIYKGNDKIKTV